MSTKPRYCVTCHGAIEPSQRGSLCGACQDWDAYWVGLTAVERAAECAMMDAYASEMAGQP